MVIGEKVENCGSIIGKQSMTTSIFGEYSTYQKFLINGEFQWFSELRLIPRHNEQLTVC